MANLIKQQVTWTGTSVTGGGISTFYFDGAVAGSTAKLTTFFTAISSGMPSGITWHIPNTGDLIDVATGSITGTWTDGTPGTVTGAGSSLFAAGVGCRIVWNTAGIRGGRRVRGTTFVVPIMAASYQTDRSIDNGVVAAVQSAASTLGTSGTNPLVIYSRPTTAHPVGPQQTVTGATVPDQVSWLRSRRT